MKCVCGMKMVKEAKGMVTTYRNKMVIIHNVPYYFCFYGHVRISRKTRVRIESLLEDAYKKGLSEINFLS